MSVIGRGGGSHYCIVAGDVPATGGAFSEMFVYIWGGHNCHSMS